MSSNQDNSSKKDEELSDEEMRKLLQPNPSHKEMIELVKTHFASSPDDTVAVKKDLDSYDDCNFWMTIGSTDYLVKVHNGVESKDTIRAMQHNDQDSVIHFQYAVMKALGDAGIPASNPIFPNSNNKPNNNNNNQMLSVPLPVLSKEHSPCPLIVSVYSWVKGTTMSALSVLPVECLADAGRLLGKMHQTFDSQRDTKSMPKSAKRFHQWDGKHTKEIQSFVKYIDNDRRRHMIQSIIDAFDTTLLQNNTAVQLFRTSVNHGDFNDANILLNDKFKVSGVIDFGDSVESWTVLDVAVAMAYAMLSPYGKPGRAISAAAAVLRGFHAVYPLTDVERQHLGLLIACRLACSVTLGAYSYQQNPENKYLLMHAEPGWKTLEFLWGYDDDNSNKRVQVGKAMNRLFDMACAKAGGANDDAVDVIDCGDLTVADEYLLLDSMQQQRPGTEEPLLKRQKLSSNTNKDEKVITFVTGNKKKLEEVQRILFADKDAKKQSTFALTNKKIDLPELQGDPIEIAKKKCEEAAKTIHGPVITEDTSLCFMSLKELPGPYIKWFLDKCGHDGLNKMIGAYDDKSAYAQTVVAYCEGPGKEVLTFDGRTMGKVVPARGKLDFGWDPIFEPDEGGGKTYAEMSKDEKDAISHRSRAFAKLKEYLLQS
ncbi:Inosine triphosphate pyrophosphatase [Seminavis robusta]|uniref:Inosine triphosphate pyrophosphatase n=1 Tax=Seminavis robusta TaxID=568900 RepID=A0A9N8EH97_9STRA|nr:Inosine triphosphate pyrophosphatase [Seminavis robusta]|eukprot:Sro1096_g240820.1 Inosine triphosphate pyrophosphatase (653) ;mRNA; f:29349-31676